MNNMQSISVYNMAYTQGEYMPKIEMIGNRFGKLTVVECAGKNNHKSLMWKCICDCGNERIVDGSGLRSGRNKSCGCSSPKFTSDDKTHGCSGKRIYRIWVAMRSRCSDKAVGKTRKNYFEKGITVCERWQTFENFLEDMGHPGELQSIDRINGNKGYSLENCRWADSKTQGNNTAANHILTANEISKTISQWADETGAKPNTIAWRVKRGWPHELAIQKDAVFDRSERSLRKRKCLVCGNEFIPRGTQLRSGQGKYCSQKCNGSSRKL